MQQYTLQLCGYPVNAIVIIFPDNMSYYVALVLIL